MHQISDEGLLAANATFYDALERGDLDSMERTWAHDGDVMCAHPGRVSLWGWPDVSESWRLIFESGRESTDNRHRRAGRPARLSGVGDGDRKSHFRWQHRRGVGAQSL